MAENLRIALAGNPNCGKTTLFNALTGLNQYVGNWPGVTVEKKEGKMKKYDGIVVVDLPGIYSLSPYTLEEVVARNYLTVERPEAILNIIDGTNIERNLYLTTQLMELGIPVVVAVNMVDILRKHLQAEQLCRLFAGNGCKGSVAALGKHLSRQCGIGIFLLRPPILADVIRALTECLRMAYNRTDLLDGGSRKNQQIV